MTESNSDWIITVVGSVVDKQTIIVCIRRVPHAYQHQLWGSYRPLDKLSVDVPAELASWQKVAIAGDSLGVCL